MAIQKAYPTGHGLNIYTLPMCRSEFLRRLFQLSWVALAVPVARVWDLARVQGCADESQKTDAYPTGHGLNVFLLRARSWIGGAIHYYQLQRSPLDGRSVGGWHRKDS